MESLKLQQLGRNYFDPNQAIMIPEYKLELWPGYVTSIRQHERDLLLCCEISNKILRTDTVLDQLKIAYQKDKTNYQNVATKLLLGQIIITRYNNKTYKIDDIIWTDNPMKSFNVSYYIFIKNCPQCIVRIQQCDAYGWNGDKAKRNHLYNNLAKPFSTVTAKPAGLDPQKFRRQTPNWMWNVDCQKKLQNKFHEKFSNFFFLIFHENAQRSGAFGEFY
jgi:hypothetical protein